jgi:hypothetical protein
MNPPASERRRARRRDILDHFSFYISIPKLGHTRHRVKDISEIGIGFDLDTLGEFKLKTGEICELQFYLNQSLFLPLHIEVVRETDGPASQDVGAVFVNVETPAHQTFNTLVHLLDQLTDSVRTAGI